MIINPKFNAIITAASILHVNTAKICARACEKAVFFALTLISGQAGFPANVALKWELRQHGMAKSTKQKMQTLHCDPTRKPTVKGVSMKRHDRAPTNVQKRKQKSPGQEEERWRHFLKQQTIPGERKTWSRNNQRHTGAPCISDQSQPVRNSQILTP